MKTDDTKNALMPVLTHFDFFAILDINFSEFTLFSVEKH